MREFVFQGPPGEKLSRFLGRVFPELGRGYFKELLRERDIKINGARVSEDTPLSSGDRIAVYAQETRLAVFWAECVLETKDIAVYVKPRGITTEEFAARVNALKPEAQVCHRLDTNTEGLLLFALSQKSFAELKEGFRKGWIKKKYLARVVGIVPSEAYHEAYLSKNGEKGLVTISERPLEGAVRIATGIKPLGGIRNDGTSLVEVDLITGKTHQIRAHLAYLGYPIAGDPKYGDYSYNRRAGLEKQKLSAYRMSFDFPKNSYLHCLNTLSASMQADFD